MNHFLNHLKNEIRDIRLTAAEKSAMRLHVMDALGSPAPVVSPYRQFLTPQIFAFSFASLLILGGGTTYAAQSALPGNALYSIKINVNERMESALAFTPEAQVAVSEKLAERRIKEVEVLAASDTLDEATTEKLAQNFDYHSEKAVTIAAKLEEKMEERSEKFAEKINASLEAIDAITMPPAADTAIAARSMTAETVLVENSEKKAEKKESINQRNAQRFAEHARAHIQALKERKQAGGL